MGRNEQTKSKYDSDSEEHQWILAFFIHKPEEPDYRIDHRDGQDDKRCEREFEHRIWAQVSAGIYISYIKYFGRGKKHESDNGHSAAKDIYNISFCKKSLDRIKTAVFFV